MNKLKLKKTREKSVLNRHPWIFSGAIEEYIFLDKSAENSNTKILQKNLSMKKNSSIKDSVIQEVTHHTNQDTTIQDGEIVEVLDFNENICGMGFFSKNSQIVCRLFEFEKSIIENWDKIDKKEYFITKIINAYQYRKTIVDFNTTNCYRLFHAEGDFLPGLIIDIYDNIAVMQISICGIEKILPFIIDGLKKIGIENICIKNPLQNSDTKSKFEILAGSIPDEIQIKENNLNFFINIKNGQKTGFFIDQKDNRLLLKSLSKDKKVLNTFSYSGAFSIYALSGGAKEVVSVDISKDAIKLCETNCKLNNFINHSGIVDDVFDYLRNIERDYFDIIILDPPAFVKNVSSIEKGSRGYKDINLQALKKIKSGGFLFTFSCSQHITYELFRKIVFSAAVDSRRNVRIVKTIFQSTDHPINIFHPESEYLKGLILYVE